jgi:hypothetical protein
VLLHGGEGAVGVAPPAHVGRDRLLHGYRPHHITHARTHAQTGGSHARTLACGVRGTGQAARQLRGTTVMVMSMCVRAHGQRTRCVCARVCACA